MSMDELQEARKLWLDELEKNVKLQTETERLRVENFELQNKLIVSQGQRDIAQMMVSESLRAMLTV